MSGWSLVLRNYLPRDRAQSSRSIACGNSLGIIFGVTVQFCCCSLLSYCVCSMLPGIDVRSGHVAIAPKSV